MNKQIFKICPILCEYHEMTQPWIICVEKYQEFYKQNKEAIDKEGRIYSEISVDRRKLGGDRKIHGVWKK